MEGETPRCVLSTLTFHTGSAVVFFKGGALKLSIRFRAAENRNIIEIQYINILNHFNHYLKSFIILETNLLDCVSKDLRVCIKITEITKNK